MNGRAIAARVLLLALLAVSGKAAPAQILQQSGAIPADWVPNWDGSGTWVFLGSPGTGNVGRTPGQVDIPQAEYSARHPGWYAELTERVREHNRPQRPDRDRDRDHDRGYDRGLPLGWIPNWDGSPTYVFLGSPGTGNVGRTPGSVDIPQAAYSARHPGWYDQLIERVNRQHWQPPPPDRYRDSDLPAGWIRNWDGSGTYVFLGSPGTGNVGRIPGRVDIPQSAYSARHPGWYDQLMDQVNHPNRWRGHDDWDRGYHAGFSDRDRGVTSDWYEENRDRLGAGWGREDRLSPADEDLIRPGRRLDYRLRQQLHWLPADLTRRYGPAPRDYWYAVLGGYVVMVDLDYQVVDVFRIERDNR